MSGTSGQGVWLPEWTVLLSKMKRIYVVPDKGEEVSGYNISSKFLGKATMCGFNAYKDYTEFRKELPVKLFFQSILGVQCTDNHYVS